MIIRFNVTTLSQPAAFVVIHIGKFVDEVNKFPCHLNESHALKFSIEVDVGLMITFIVTALSQPTEFVRCATCVPAALKVIPFQVIGKAAAQIELSFIDVDVGLIVTFNIAVESHPTLFGVGP